MFQSSKPINLEQNLWTTRVLLPCIAFIIIALGALRLAIDHALIVGPDIGVAAQLAAFVFLGGLCWALTRLLAGPPLLVSVDEHELVVSHGKSGRPISRYSLDVICPEAGYFSGLAVRAGGPLTVLKLRVNRRLLLVAPKRDARYVYRWSEERTPLCFSPDLAAPTHFVSDSEFRRLIRPLGLDPAFVVRPAPCR